MVELYPYQAEAVDAMFDKHGFILGDDMGLGKTYEALAEVKQFSIHYGFTPTTLIICPKGSVMEQWQESAALFFDEGELECFRYINYEALFMRKRKDDPHAKRLDIVPAVRGVWDYVIADEAHKIKNRKAKQARALKKVRGMHKRALTGTPIINRPDELWSILHWLDPKTWSSYWRFFEEYVSYETIYPVGYKKVVGPKNVDKLRAEIAPYFLRRTKAEVLKDLPDKYYTYRRIEMTAEQKRNYAEMKEHSHAWIEQQPDDLYLIAPTVLAQLTRLRQFACASCSLTWVEDADGIPLESNVAMREPSNKLDALVEIIEDTATPVVVYSQFTQLVNLASERLTKHGIEHVVMTGATPQGTRREIVTRFASGEVPVFLANMQTGGIGVDGLQHASQTVVFLDRAWSPALNTQAEDRLHRNGQDNAVQVIILQSKASVDLIVEARVELKKEWFLQVIEGKQP